MRQFHAGVSRHVACNHHTLIHFMGLGQNCLVTRLGKARNGCLKPTEWPVALGGCSIPTWKVRRSCLDTAYFRIQRTRVFFFPWLGGSSSAYLGPWWSLGAAKIPCSTSLGVLGAWHDRWTGRLLGCRWSERIHMWRSPSQETSPFFCLDGRAVAINEEFRTGRINWAKMGIHVKLQGFLASRFTKSQKHRRVPCALRYIPVVQKMSKDTRGGTQAS